MPMTTVFQSLASAAGAMASKAASETPRPHDFMIFDPITTLPFAAHVPRARGESSFGCGSSARGALIPPRGTPAWAEAFLPVYRMFTLTDSGAYGRVCRERDTVWYMSVRHT